MRLAYADPPYPGQARRHYADDPRCAEVNHEVLIGTLCEYDGWALSTSSAALRDVLALCPEGVRVGAWVKPFAAWRKNVVPAMAWEPVIFTTTKKRALQGYETLGVARDWIMATPPIFRRQNRDETRGSKPIEFCLWVLDCLGYEPSDTLDDLFPGSGIMAEAVRMYGRQKRLFRSEPAPKAQQGSLV